MSQEQDEKYKALQWVRNNLLKTGWQIFWIQWKRILTEKHRKQLSEIAEKLVSTGFSLKKILQ